MWPIFPAMGVSMLVVGLVRLSQGQSVPSALTAFVVVLLAAIVVIPFLIAMMGDRMFKRLPHKTATWDIDTEAAQISSGGRTSRLPLEGLWWEERRDLILLYPSVNTFQALPLSEVSPEDKAAVLALLRTHATPAPVQGRRYLVPMIVLAMGVGTAIALTLRG